ncbi:uncharacterized protein N7469_006904 [Penicillium citrinum]|uniref:PLC-like phosphodiesterase n=2 Tax=Penicillium TaxID=5073 RepID=A0A9W9NXP9_PENCI|nr:uncharacterized protein N7469_006904 [Penicillium citrinum]KAJ5226898.1 hypothetical protein N7469_006904 [Penicillium citrinum]KAJ5568645.1 hypothetical protein N7450_011131 [Penicillium hetheringtonii]
MRSLPFSLLGLGLITLCTAKDGTTTETTDGLSTSITGSSSSFNWSDASTITSGSQPIPTGSYLTYTSVITLDNGDHKTVTSSSLNGSTTATGNQTQFFTSTSDSVTVLVGGGTTTTLHSNSTMNSTRTHSTTSSTPTQTNTTPCNGYSEFCMRNYSNITNVAAHNSPFVVPGNAASNQAFKVTDQLNDGIRMLQFQAHNKSGEIHLCHSSCDILDAGPLTDYLAEVYRWMAKNPYNVVTFLMGNSDLLPPEAFVPAIEDSGLKNIIYSPPKAPMALNDWPTLSEMILKNKRAVFFMDYQANETAVPYIMDEFSQLWETPFSPTNRDFPCYVQRPPGLNRQDASNRMYMINHNLNLELNFGSLSLLIPNTADMVETNSANVSQYGSLGNMSARCTRYWDRPPNFLLVDYYNWGRPNGSVFEVAAEMNGVKWNGDCCGSSSAAAHMSIASVSTVMLVAAGAHFLLSAF